MGAATGGERAQGPLRPLRERPFLDLWIAALVSNVGTWMGNVGAAWYMASLTDSPLVVSLVQSATYLPVAIVGIVAGALADVVDRRRLLLATQTGMMVAAALLATATFMGLVTPALLLTLMFLFGLAFAFNGPASKAVIDDLVPAAQLPAAVALNGVVVNVGRAAGPALAGVLIAGAGPGAVFAVNALSFVGALLVLARWRRPTPPAPGPRERVGEAVSAGVRFVRFSPEITAVLVRTVAFIASGSALWALVPIVASQELSLDSTGYGALLAFFGIGTVGWTGIRERVEERLSPETLVTSATVMFALTMATVAVVRSLSVLYLAMSVGGVAWIALLTSFNVATQTAVAGWVRARGLAAFQTVFMIGMGGGGAVWGAVAQQWGVRTALLAGAVGVALGLLTRLRWPMTDLSRLDLSPVGDPAPAPADLGDDPPGGQVLVTVEYTVDADDAEQFLRLTQLLGPARRRTGASRWELFQDTDRPSRFVEQFVVRSWSAHLRQHELISATDRALEERIWQLHAGDEPPPTWHMLQVDGQVPLRPQRLDTPGATDDRADAPADD
jgi:MFS family permease